jgi:hypothetical protein
MHILKKGRRKPAERQMTLDEEKIRFGMLALGGLTFVLSALGIELPLEPVQGWGTT